MDRRRLECFVALAEELHFSRAASRTGISQPGLSQQLRQLEEQLQVELVRRSKRQVALTRAGEVFLDEARKVLAGMARAVELTRNSQQGVIGRLRIGTAPSALFITLPEIVMTFRAALPDVEIDVSQMSTEEQLVALRDGMIDVGLMHPPLAETSGLVIEELFEYPFRIAIHVHNPLLEKPDLELTDLVDQNFILFPRALGPQSYDDIIASCRNQGFSPRKIIEAAPAQSIVALAACNFGVGFVASDVQLYDRPLVTYRSLGPGGPAVRIATAHRRDAAPPIVKQFLAAARRSHPVIGPSDKQPE
jgi:DNA-binding transcriptional LysR family regulator